MGIFDLFSRKPGKETRKETDRRARQWLDDFVALYKQSSPLMHTFATLRILVRQPNQAAYSEQETASYQSSQSSNLLRDVLHSQRANSVTPGMILSVFFRAGSRLAKWLRTALMK
jgi:hypothetical protein